ncbi:MAG: acyltransferase family protein [Patescibacteria group bacterium]|nr:DUF1624 domain-containing protein [Patescibacteria group bacterium]
MNHNGKHRIVALDILRGVAVFLMVLAHTISFIYKGNSETLELLKNVGNTVCFTTFLFTSGVSSYLAYIRIPENSWNRKRKSLSKRLLALILGYYLVAFVSRIDSIGSVQDVIRILILRDVPGYTEFLIPFVVFGILILFGRSFIKRISSSVSTTLVLSVFFFVLGSTIYDLNTGGLLKPYISILAGADGLYRFPLFQYFPVYLIGLNFGSRLKSNGGNIKIMALRYIPAQLISMFVFFLPWEIPHINTFNRWPPSIFFISVGLLFSLLTLVFTEIIHKKKSLKKFAGLGKTALGIYIWHDIILQINSKVFEYETELFLPTILAFALVLSASFGLVTLTRYSRFKVKSSK